MPDPATASAPIMISSDASLTTACRRWSAAGVIGLDTEFIRERTYYPRPALLQVSDAQGVLLVDPTEISDFGPFAKVLADPAVLVVMHACGEDLEVLDVMTETTPRRIFDTQLAAAFAGHRFSLGYRELVATLLDVTLDKGETRSNWLRRPLSPSQLHYAALDVLYLLPLYRHLSSALDRLERTSWLEEEFEHQRRARAADSRPAASYLRIRGRGALSPARHAVLRRLSAWRESEAMDRDMPRRHLLPDQALITLANTPAPTGGRLNPARGMSAQAQRRYGSTVAERIGRRPRRRAGRRRLPHRPPSPHRHAYAAAGRHPAGSGAPRPATGVPGAPPCAGVAARRHAEERGHPAGVSGLAAGRGDPRASRLH